MGSVAVRTLVWLIDAYGRWFSVLKGGPTCRFYPSCSEYARRAILIHGAGRGLLLATWRLLRCNPLSRGGYDPVPEAEHRKEAGEQERGF